MNCEHVVRSMMEYLDGELEGSAADALARHLAACPSCAARSRFERTLKVRLQESVRVSPPARLRQRVADMLRSG